MGAGDDHDDGIQWASLLRWEPDPGGPKTLEAYAAWISGRARRRVGLDPIEHPIPGEYWRGSIVAMTRPTPSSIILACAVSAILGGCDPARPTLGAVLSRVDVPRILECAELAGIERAECLGAEALTTGLDVACDHAAELAKKATAAQGSDPELAGELDKALGEVAREVEATRTP